LRRGGALRCKASNSSLSGVLCLATEEMAGMHSNGIEVPLGKLHIDGICTQIPTDSPVPAALKVTVFCTTQLNASKTHRQQS